MSDVAWCTVNHTDVGGQIDAGVVFCINCIACACTVVIPDTNFKAYLVGNTAINTSGDAEIQCSEAIAFTGMIDCTNFSISDLTGIETFTSLTRLRCGNNLLTTLDITQNTDLTYISCSGNSISALDLSQCSTLDTLYCYLNSLTSLDVSQNPALSEFLCNDNLLTSLDVSQNPNINELWCKDNQLIFLNLANGNNTNVGALYAQNNPNLTCIQVDDAAYSTSNWPFIDATASFSENCLTAGVSESTSIAMNVFPNPASTLITFNSEDQIESIIIIDMFGSTVQNESEASFSIEELNSGIYIAIIQTDTGLTRVRFVKE